jgi:uncharacterized iron-regulated membrane protein
MRPLSIDYDCFVARMGYLAMPLNSRTFHRKSAPILFLPLLLTAITGIVYRVGRAWLNIPDATANFLMVIHQGGFLGAPLVPIYVLLMGVGLLAMIATGLVMLKRKAPKKAKQDWRSLHRWLAPIAFLPLIVSAVTGIGYRLGQSWFNLPREQTALLLRIHQGAYLGNPGRVIYVVLIGLGLVGLLISGINLSGVLRRPARS